MFFSNSKIEIHDYTGLTPDSYNNYKESEIKKTELSAFFEDQAIIEQIKYSSSRLDNALMGSVNQVDAKISISKELPDPTKCKIRLFNLRNNTVDIYYEVLKVVNFAAIIAGSEAYLKKIEKPLYQLETP